jgi:hypothetical protein
MTPATQSALLLLAAGLIHSFCLMCHKLPAARQPAFYPRQPLARTAINLVWILLFLAGIRLALALSTALGIAAAIIYFVVLPFVFQPPLARMLGFNDLQEYLNLTDRHKSRKI